MFALTQIPAGTPIAPYRGEVIDVYSSPASFPVADSSGHTFCFGLSDGAIIDGAVGGNSMRWLNHSCVPNCEAWEQGDGIVIMSTRDIAVGEELVIDYQLDAELAEWDRGTFRCSCRTAACRGTMLAD